MAASTPSSGCFFGVCVCVCACVRACARACVCVFKGECVVTSVLTQTHGCRLGLQRVPRRACKVCGRPHVRKHRRTCVRRPQPAAAAAWCWRRRACCCRGAHGRAVAAPPRRLLLLLLLLPVAAAGTGDDSGCVPLLLRAGRCAAAWPMRASASRERRRRCGGAPASGDAVLHACSRPRRWLRGCVSVCGDDACARATAGVCVC
jgi:hypothetical protein